ncbi:MAG: hypothetical protein ACI8RD_003312 [Bacillariaceae sp.]|jgi:hypothetical protein
MNLVGIATQNSLRQQKLCDEKSIEENFIFVIESKNSFKE